MPLPMLPATSGIETSTAGSFLNTLIYDFLPAVAVWAGLMAAIWIACAAIAVAGTFIGGIVVVVVRDRVRGVLRYLRRRRGVEYAHLVAVDEDGAHTKIVNFENYRRRRHQHRSDDAQPDDRYRGDVPHRCTVRSTVNCSPLS